MWFPIGPDFVCNPINLDRVRLSRRNEAGAQAAIVSISVGPHRGGAGSRPIYIVAAPNTRGRATGSIFRSDDDGASWTPCLEDFLRSNVFKGNMSAVAAHPSDDGKVYAATDGGYLLVSSDWGASWITQPIHNPPETFIQDLVVVPGTSGANTVLFVAGGQRVLYSPFDGNGWGVVFDGGPGAMVRLSRSLWPNQSLYMLCANPTSASTTSGIYYCTPHDPSGAAPTFTLQPGSATLPAFANQQVTIGRIDCCQNGRIYAYLINGGTATAVDFVTAQGPLDTLHSPLAAGSLPTPDFNAPYWGLSLAITPNSAGSAPGPGNNDVLLIGTIGLWRSADGGRSWQQAPSIPHADLHAFAFGDPPAGTTVPPTFLGCDGGIARSYRIADPGLATLPTPMASDYGDGITPAPPATQSWLWENMNHQLNAVAGERYASPPNYTALSYLASQDTSVSKGNGSLGFRQVHDLNGDGRAVAAAYSPNGVVLWTLNGSPFLLWRTLDDGTMNPSTVAVTVGSGPDRPDYADTDPAIPYIRYGIDAGGNCIAGVRTNSGRNLVMRIDATGQGIPIHADFPVTVSALLLQVALDPGSPAIYCTTIDNRVFYTPDLNGSTGWQDISANLPTGVNFLDGIAVNRSSEAFVIANTTSGTLLFSVSTSGAWTAQLIASPPTEDALRSNVILVADPDSGDRLYLAQGRKVYQLDRTSPNNWATTDLSDFSLGSSGGLAGNYINDLWAGKMGTRTLLRATLSPRGIWEREVNALSGSPTVYLRNHPADLGWAKPGPEGSPSPFGTAAGWLGHWQSPDIKVEMAQPAAPTGVQYQTDPEYANPLTSQLEHDAFDMLRSDASSMTVGRTARVHVQIHQRNYVAAAGLRVWVLFCEASLLTNPLPSTFWSRFHSDGTIDDTSPLTGGWTAVGPSRSLDAPGPSVTSPAVVSWDWPAASSIGGGSHYCLVAIVHGPTPYNVTSQATGVTFDAIVPTNTQLGQRNVIWLAPGSTPTPPVPWTGEPNTERFMLRFHNPYEGVVKSDIVFYAPALPKSAKFSLRFVGKSAQLISTGVTRQGHGRKLTKQQLSLLGEILKERAETGVHFEPDHHGVIHIDGLKLPSRFVGTLVFEVVFPAKLKPGSNYTIEAIQRVVDLKGHTTVGGITIQLAGPPRREKMVVNASGE